MAETNKDRAERFGISESYFYRLRKAGIDVDCDDELRAAIAGDESSDDAQRLLKARADRAEHLAEKDRLALEVERGRHVLAEKVQSEGQRAGQMLQSRLFQLARHDLPPRLAGLDAAEIATVLDDAVWNVLNEISKEFGAIASGDKSP